MDGKQKAIELMKKVTLDSSRQQLEILEKVIQTYLTHTTAKGLESRATAFRIFRLYESKIRKKLYSTKRVFKISLDVSEAQALAEMFRLLNYFEFDPYTETTMNLITASINQQTI